MKISSAWPNKSQLTLLKAALLPTDQAEAHWNEFIAEHDLQELDHGCTQVLPMAFINLKDRMKEGINKKICLSSYKYVWAKNHLLMHDAKTLLALLNQHNIDICVLKGAAFIGHYYPDYGMRVLGDIDLLVSPKQMPALVDLLESNQYKIKSNQSGVNTRSLLKLFHARSFVNDRGTDFDIHQYLSPFLVDTAFTEKLWKNKRPINLFGKESLAHVLSPTYQLLHTVLHGLQHAPASSVRWVVDATNLLNHHSADIDWKELIAVCSKHHLNLPISQALSFLSEELQLAIPDYILSYYNRIQMTAKDKEYYVRSSNLGFQRMIERITSSWKHYKSYSSDDSQKLNISGFYHFLQIYLDIKSPWMLLPHITMKTFGVLFRSLKIYFK